jgi:hypothetical protein
MNLLLACAVCFGDAGPQQTQAQNAGIFVLLGVTGIVLGGFVAKRLFLASRSPHQARRRLFLKFRRLPYRITEWIIRNCSDSRSTLPSKVARSTPSTAWCLLMAVLFVGWILLFFFMLVRFRRGAHPRADHEGVKSHASSYVEAVIAAGDRFAGRFSIPFWSKKVSAF